jgi:hypothetical protein
MAPAPPRGSGDGDAAAAAVALAAALKAQGNAAYGARRFDGARRVCSLGALPQHRGSWRESARPAPSASQPSPRPAQTSPPDAAELYGRALLLAPADRALLGNRSAARLAAGRVEEAVADAQVGG